MKRLLMLLLIGFMMFSCNHDKKENRIDEDKLGIIDADVKSEETNLKTKANYNDEMPGATEKISRSFENAPPLIPHTIAGFLPIRIDNNICMSCHLPEKVKESGAVEIPKTHFTSLRPKMDTVNGKLAMTPNKTVFVKDLSTFNNAYFNCSQCHVPQTEISVDIENLFTPEFRNEFGIEKSDLKDKIKEGI